MDIYFEKGAMVLVMGLVYKSKMSHSWQMR